MELTVAITGASGMIYAERTLKLLAESGIVETINLVVSDSATTVAKVELGVNLREPNAQKVNEWLGLDASSKLIRFWRLDNLAAKPSSGSNKQAGMIIVPCSMATIGAIASGAGTNHSPRRRRLSQGGPQARRRASRDSLQRDPPRKHAPPHPCRSPDSPASPGFYHRPQTIDDLVQHLCYRILDQFDIPHSSKTAWTGEEIKHAIAQISAGCRFYPRPSVILLGSYVRQCKPLLKPRRRLREISPGLSARDHEFLVRGMRSTKDSIVADVGCGPGISSKMFLENGNRVIGVEPNDAMREAANEYFAAYDNFEVIDGRSDATTLADA